MKIKLNEIDEESSTGQPTSGLSYLDSPTHNRRGLNVIPEGSKESSKSRVKENGNSQRKMNESDLMWNQQLNDWSGQKQLIDFDFGVN